MWQKVIFQVSRTKTLEKIEPLKAHTGELVENYKNMSTLMKDYRNPCISRTTLGRGQYELS